MLRTASFLLLLGASSGFGQTNAITITSAASNSTDLAAESLASALGSNLAPGTAIPSAPPWPTSLGGVHVQVIDSGNVSRAAGLLFVSPTQVNFQIPAGTALGVAAVFLDNGSATFTAQVPVRPVAPALFAMDPSGTAAATGIRVTLATGMQSSVPVFLCVDPAKGCQPVPIDVGVDAPVYLSFYGTGIRGRDQLSNVTVTIGSTNVAPLYAGPQEQFPGLDQVNVPLPLTLRGSGAVNVTVNANGVVSNPVKVQIQ
ncbi:MAG TPA: hypothetical protein VMH28_22175 [Candidatus Acidoferrales bacterium]|nr:hypothetical protein [Candidatus Acidoferrales bacterium]